jgi:predicted transcriptional regulator
MNSKHIASRIPSALIDPGTYNAVDCIVLNKVVKQVIKHGAISVERLQKITKISEREIHWALHHLEAKRTSADLYVLPE